jgi:AcrR family transcriptional regulator
MIPHAPQPKISMMAERSPHAATQAVRGRRGAPVKRTRAAAARDKKKPGRPNGTSTVREAILTAAEKMFADLGYAGTTLREIADAAHVTQALINYYFGSKFALFEEVYLRRAVEVASERLVNLETLEELWALTGEPTAVQDIVRAFLEPSLALRSTPEGRNFLRLQSRLHTEPPHLSYRLRSGAYDRSTRGYVQLLRRVMPRLSALEAYWRISMMIGTYLYAFSDTHRMDELAGRDYDAGDSAAILEQVTRFLTGGLQAE